MIQYTGASYIALKLKYRKKAKLRTHTVLINDML